MRWTPKERLILIAGVPEASKVLIYERLPNGKSGEKLLEDEAAPDGTVRGRLNARWVGHKLRLVVPTYGHVFFDTVAEVSEYGLIRAVRMEHDRNVFRPPPSSALWKPEAEYEKARVYIEEVLDRIQRQKPALSGKTASVILLELTATVGLSFAIPWVAIPAGLILVVGTWVVSNRWRTETDYGLDLASPQLDR